MLAYFPQAVRGTVNAVLRDCNTLKMANTLKMLAEGRMCRAGSHRVLWRWVRQVRALGCDTLEDGNAMLRFGFLDSQ